MILPSLCRYASLNETTEISRNIWISRKKWDFMKSSYFLPFRQEDSMEKISNHRKNPSGNSKKQSIAIKKIRAFRGFTGIHGFHLPTLSDAKDEKNISTYHPMVKYSTVILRIIPTEISSKPLFLLLWKILKNSQIPTLVRHSRNKKRERESSKNEEYYSSSISRIVMIIFFAARSCGFIPSCFGCAFPRTIPARIRDGTWSSMTASSAIVEFSLT